MKVKYVGFNVFGVVSEITPIIKSFTEFTYDSIKSLHLTHTFAIVESDKGVFLNGYFNKKTHQCIEIKTDREKIIKKISVYDNWGFILYETGEIFEINLDCDLKLQEVYINVNKDDRVIDISVGSEFMIAVTKEGKVYKVPDMLDIVDKEIKQVATGREHCILLNKSGNVYTFGSGSKGQLGHGDLTNQENLVHVEALGGIKIKKVAAGGWHSCALSESGDVYTWGWNQENQLGLFDVEDKDKKSVVATPEPVNFPDFEANVDDIACGTKHTVALLGNKLYGAGMNKYHQLGSWSSDDKTPMKCIHEIEGKKLSVICGPWSTAVLIEDEKQEGNI